ncbi:hypothetical protein M5X11_25285 [Paenibacillus alginolyticus]|uniref:Uncharacterized protein n=1 Tax=Paenibacillus alginolyticus TaxID=59839 RepID=A0ABT4GJZ8_9BACL|nr:hypothetical protein [Paenibacillus alginolyticus]MCY9668197.1 hypothetical protein [Paenibacillus alginolyticus]MCY9696524.1 hypothetical protein [Paenibacillus alginolyticus]MEC0148613.1 hypothetical protein [Paenibacillus alginolyticus]
MRRKFSPIEVAIAILIAIGLLVSLRTLFIPILVLGIIFLLYKFPPSRWRKISTGRGPAKGKRKNAKFRVINGSKDSDSDDFPKYH